MEVEYIIARHLSNDWTILELSENRLHPTARREMAYQKELTEQLSGEPKP